MKFFLIQHSTFNIAHKKRTPFALKKESFYTTKRVLLHFKRSPFALQKEPFCTPKGVLLKNPPLSLGETILRFMVFPLSRNRESTIFAA